ncbi:hypothetical protein AB0H71_02610 [Nocardia sp. NPDC050697]|uniref:hypothetical protein n=1 Tax=Nocardia sp. NPDC050697 TaxID=3155158 RepID=UPI0034045786
MRHLTSRRARFGLLALWPAGLLLALATESLDVVPAALVFALSIPFMATLSPFLLGAALLGTGRIPQEH